MQPARSAFALAGAVVRARLALGDAVGEDVDQLLGAGVDDGNCPVLPIGPLRARGYGRYTHPGPSCAWKVDSGGVSAQEDLTFQSSGRSTVA